ncbi:acyl-ACP--UDP-N-acetylglucosamine O-acyltransferase [Candidatus Endowatersipora endosymbiont of Watersipora subatra]|uniref:acyl-ACP--UDP-N-acetylglucosamine O-acyltransferase n=1 Tax=Candidatus Endowatersipora endosymbiont of Watersipora subatra TaxID=3077946 RepID=UPI00312CBAB0
MVNNNTIHPSSLVESGAVIGSDTIIGPFCHIGAEVKLAEGVKVLSHVSIAGKTSVGSHTRIFPFASIGQEPQDLKFSGEDVFLEIGSECTIREGVTMNPGTLGGGGVTRIGNKCTFLANSHVAHDCIIGNNVIFSNNVMLAGHCVVGDFVIFGGGAAAHQFCRVGHHAFIGGLSGIEGDVIPFGMAIGPRASLAGVNIVGMKRATVSRESINAMRKAYIEVFSRHRPIRENAQALKSEATNTLVIDILDFVLESADRPLCIPYPD